MDRLSTATDAAPYEGDKAYLRTRDKQYFRTMEKLHECPMTKSGLRDKLRQERSGVDPKAKIQVVGLMVAQTRRKLLNVGPVAPAKERAPLVSNQGGSNVSIGPLQVVVIGFEGSQFTGEILPERKLFARAEDLEIGLEVARTAG